MNVIRSDPRQRGFTQPCPLWQGQCTIYTSPHYPHVCRSYRCKLLKEVLDDTTLHPESLAVVQQAKEMINELEALLPVSPNDNFRERLVAHIEKLEQVTEPAKAELIFQKKATALLIFFKKHFGVKDFLNEPEEM